MDGRRQFLSVVDIRVMMRLTNRHIGIARDIPEGSCRFARISAHYRHHAEADEAVFQRYVLKLTATLGKTKGRRSPKHRA